MGFSTKRAKPVSLWGSQKDLASDLGDLVSQSVTLAANLDVEREYLKRRAPNAIEWIVDRRFCNQPQSYKFWGSYRLVKEFFELRCPDCNTPEVAGESFVPSDPWGLSRTQLESEVLLVWSEDQQDDVCPKCRTPRAQFIEDEEFNGYRNLLGLIGQRSGKSTTLGMIGTYIEHVLSTIGLTHADGLYGYLNHPRGDPLHMTFIASTATQAKETIWAKYKGYRANAPWFRRYVPWVKAQESIQVITPGMEPWSYTENSTHIHNGLLGLSVDSLNSNSNGIAGRTRVASLIDEICRMEQTESSRSAQEVYRSMDASVQTVQGTAEQFGLPTWLGLTAAISSVMSVNDYGMQLLESSKTDSRVYARKMATWDFNPYLPRSRFADMLKKDFVGTMRNFGSVPPAAATPLIDRPDDFIRTAVDKTLTPTATFTYYDIPGTHGNPDMLGVKVDDMRPLFGATPRVIAVDAGKNFDAFSVACAHGDTDADGNVITVFDWVIRLLTRNKSQEVYFESVYQLLKSLVPLMPISKVMFDHWQSTTIIQRLRNEFGIWSEEEVTTNEHFIRFMRDCYSGYVKLLPELDEDPSFDPPYKSAQGAALYELLHLERDPKNDNVFNPAKGKRRGYDSDDTARVIVHAHRLVQDSGFTERQDDTSRRARRIRAEASTADWNSSVRGGVFNFSKFTKGGGRGW